MGWHISAILKLVFALLVGSWLSWAGDAPAYPTPVDFDGKLMRWNVNIDDPPIYYTVEADVDDDLYFFESYVDASADMWTAVDTSYFTFARATDIDRSEVTVVLQRQLDDTPLSAGYSVFDEADDYGPLHCSVHILVEPGLSGRSIAKTILHELGHCIGLGHSLIPQAVMSYYFEDNAFALDIDDEAAITRLYPADGGKPKLPPGCAVGEPISGSSMLVLLCFLLPLFLPVTSIMTGRRNV